MKIVTILGNPRKKGNTTKVLSMFEIDLIDNYRGWQVSNETVDWINI